MLSKVKKGIKIKIKPEDSTSASAEVKEFPGTSAKDMKAEALRRKAANRNPQNKELPLVGNVDEYSKLVKSSGEASSETKAESSDESEEEDEGDGLWGAIMGQK